MIDGPCDAIAPVGLAGAGRARVWRPYLAGSALAFNSRRVGVDQVLARAPGPAGPRPVPVAG